MTFTFDEQQIVSLSELPTKAQELKVRLDAGESLIVFHENRPQFWLVGLEHLSSVVDQSAPIPDAGPQPAQDSIKIGALVRMEIGRLCRQNSLSSAELQKLCDPSYCKQTFRTSCAVLKPLDGRQSLNQQCKDARGYNRYYHTPYTCSGQRFLLSNTWYEHQRPLFLRWLAGLTQ